MNPQDLNGLKEKNEFEKLMTSAHIYRMRGDYLQARRQIRLALDMRPNDLDAREFAADLLFAAGKIEAACEEYKSIYNDDNTRTAAEEKFAKATLQIAEGKRQKDLLKMMADDPVAFKAHQLKYSTGKKSVIIAIILSLAPGFGQIYCEKVVRGIILFVSTALSWLIFLAARPDVSYYPTTQRALMFLKEMNPAAILFLSIAVMLQVYALVDAAVLADKSQHDIGENDISEPQQ